MKTLWKRLYVVIFLKDDIIAYGLRTDKSTGERGSSPYLLKNKALLTGASLETAKVQISDRFGDLTVGLNI